MASLHGSHVKRFIYESYHVRCTLAQGQINLRIFLNATDVLNFAGWFDTTYYLKQDNRFRVFSLHYGWIPSLHFMLFCKSVITLWSHPTHYFKVNCKTNYLGNIDNTIYQNISKEVGKSLYPTSLLYLRIFLYILLVYFRTAFRICTVLTIS